MPDLAGQARAAPKVAVIYEDVRERNDFNQERLRSCLAVNTRQPNVSVQRRRPIETTPASAATRVRPFTDQNHGQSACSDADQCIHGPGRSSQISSETWTLFAVAIRVASGEMAIGWLVPLNRRVSSRRGAPPSTGTISTIWLPSDPTLRYAICLLSGHQIGQPPRSVTRRRPVPSGRATKTPS
jgi:hypothetical protein